MRTREVFVFVRRGGRYLILRRSEVQGGYWHGVAGGIEAYLMLSDPAVADAPSGWDPVLDWEHDEYRWCALDEADALLHWPEPREVLHELNEREGAVAPSLSDQVRPRGEAG